MHFDPPLLEVGSVFFRSAFCEESFFYKKAHTLNRSCFSQPIVVYIRRTGLDNSIDFLSPLPLGLQAAGSSFRGDGEIFFFLR